MKIQQIKVESQNKEFQRTSHYTTLVKSNTSGTTYHKKYFYSKKLIDITEEQVNITIKMSSLYNLNPILNQKEITYYSCSKNIRVKCSFCYN